MTQKLYLTNNYLKEFEAVIEKIESNSIALNQTAFYPQGGGLPSDTGKIISNNKEFEVIHAKAIGEEVFHELKTTDDLRINDLSIGEKVKGIIDWEKRHKIMRMHTTAHIFSKIILNETGSMITGNQVGLEQTRMDFSAKTFDKEFLEKIESQANKVAEQQLEVTIDFLEREKALQLPELFRLKDVLPKNIPILRIISIGSFDKQADGGPHVQNTKEIGRIRIIKTENKGAENKRIYFELE